MREKDLNIRVRAIHLTAPVTDHPEIKQEWQDIAPPRSRLIMDEDQLLETAFLVRGVPHTVLIIPREKKMLTLVGDVKWGRPSLEDLIKDL